MITKPMLAASIENLDDIQYPVLCTPKLDGVRCLKINGRAVTRAFKPVPNAFVREFIEANYPDGVDGELMTPSPVGTAFDAGPLMHHTGEPDFVFNCFDYVPRGDLLQPYKSRITVVESLNLPKLMPVVPGSYIRREADLLAYEHRCLDAGYEGVMLRSPDGPYKCGRSTVREGYLLKLKRFADSEAVILGLYEQMHNANAAQQDAFGRTKRSSHKDNKIGKATLGAFFVRDVKTGIEFNIGTGMNDEFRAWAWQHPRECIDKICKYKSQSVGVKDAPRFPVWLGFRDAADMS
jgi:DNA ligase-1